MQLPPPIHGASLMNSYLIKSDLIRRNYKTSFVNLQFSNSMNELSKFSFRKIFKMVKYGFAIIGKILGNRPDLVYFTLTPVGFALYRDAFYVFILKIFKVKIVFHLHGKGIQNNANQSRINKELYKWVFNNTNIICLSERLVSDIKDYNKTTVYTIPNGIPDRKKILKPAHSNKSTPNILYLSNYFKSKGILVLIEALGILNKRGFKFNAKLVGADGNLTVEMLENIIRKENLSEMVKVTGPKFGIDKFIEFQKADIFIHPTYNDAFPLVCIEAMQFYLPVISTDEGGIPDIVLDNETGFIVEPKNTLMLAEKISILLNNEALRLEMGEKGYERYLNNYTIDHFEKNVNATFQTILGR